MTDTGPPIVAAANRPEAAPLTAFVSAGGTSLAAIQAGMLQALYEREIVPDLLVATSAGALKAASVATSPPTPATAKQLADFWRGLRRDDMFPVSPRAVIGGLTNHSNHLVRDSGLRALAREQAEIAHYATSVQLIAPPAVSPDHVQPTDFDPADQLIHHGLLSERQVLDAAPTAGRTRGRSASKAV